MAYANDRRERGECRVAGRRRSMDCHGGDSISYHTIDQRADLWCDVGRGVPHPSYLWYSRYRTGLCALCVQYYFSKMASPIDGFSPPPLTPFQKRVYDAVARIPRGYVRSYGSMAVELGTSARAVGTAMGRVPSGSPVP